jgi:hypothetical protein
MGWKSTFLSIGLLKILLMVMCKRVCMAECLSPGTVGVSDFFKIFVPTEQVGSVVMSEISELRLSLEVTVNRNMFC